MKNIHVPFQVSLFMLLAANFSTAQVDPDPDGIGVYFDVEATNVSTTAVTGEFVQAYLVGTNLSQSGDIDYWEAYVFPDQGASVSGTPYGSFNYAMNMPGDPSWHCVALWPEPPLPAQTITLLASLEIQVLDDSLPIGLFIRGDARYRLYGSLEEFPLFPSSGSPDLPAATINGEAPVAIDPGAWGSLKAMFR